MSRLAVPISPPSRPRPRRAAALAALVLLASTGLVGLQVEAAHAEATIPQGSATGVTAECVSARTAAFSCTYGGYDGKASQESSSTWKTSYYWSSGLSVPDTGDTIKHNCTTYIQFRLMQNHIAYPGWTADAGSWAKIAASKGTVVNQTPTVGSVAEYLGGHVSYVEEVNKDWIVTTSDNYHYGTNRMKILRSSPSWPDSFIHLGDITPLHLSFDKAAGYNWSDGTTVHTGVEVTGWALDLNDLSDKSTIRIGVDAPWKSGAPAGSTGVADGTTTAAAVAKYKEFGAGTTHGFDLFFDAHLSGTHTVYVTMVSPTGRSTLTKGPKTFSIPIKMVESAPVTTTGNDGTDSDDDPGTAGIDGN